MLSLVWHEHVGHDMFRKRAMGPHLGPVIPTNGCFQALPPAGIVPPAVAYYLTPTMICWPPPRMVSLEFALASVSIYATTYESQC